MCASSPRNFSQPKAPSWNSEAGLNESEPSVEEGISSPIDSNHDSRGARSIALFASVQRPDGWSL